MPKHHSLSLATFVKSIEWDFFQQYFNQFDIKQRPQGWEAFNHDAMQKFLDDPMNAETAAIIEEDFQRINDIAQEGMGIIVRACQKYNIKLEPDETPAQLAMRMFLDNSDAFEFAWSRYILYNSTSRLSIYPLPGIKNLTISPLEIDAFQDGVSRWFSELAKGDQCVVQPFDDRGETVIVVRHGTYIRTIPFWEGNEISMNSFRPALEDVLVYEPAKSRLYIKAGLAKDREQYLRLFAAHIAKDPTLADRALSAQVFNLTSLQDGTFNFAGSGPIMQIELIKVRMALYGISNPIIELKAENIQAAFKHDLGSLSMNSGLLLLARFRFHLSYPNQRPIKVTFEIEPPARTDLAQRHYTQVIEDYLEEQGVKLH